jgi:hypothetical protein
MWSWPIEDNITALLKESNATQIDISGEDSQYLDRLQLHTCQT